MGVSSRKPRVGSSAEPSEAAARERPAPAKRTRRGLPGIGVLEKRVKVETERIIQLRLTPRVSLLLGDDGS